MDVLRETPGLPDARIQPPVVAEAGDPFAELRVVHLLARIPRGQPVRVRDIVDRLNAEHLDWSFSRAVVIAAIVQLQANWRADYRNSDGIVLQDGPAGPELLIEDSSRVDPWIVRQVERAGRRAWSGCAPSPSRRAPCPEGRRAAAAWSAARPGRRYVAWPGRPPRGPRAPAPGRLPAGW